MSDTRYVASTHPFGTIPDKDERMDPPPAGTVQVAAIGDAPLDAKDDYDSTSRNPPVVYIVCVLQGDWPGSSADIRQRCPDLGAHYVRTLYELVSRHAPSGVAWRFICFTDRPAIEGVVCRPLAAGCWNYFAKLYLFAEGHFPEGARVLFLDLDTVLVGSWAPLIDPDKVPLNRLVMLRDLWAERKPASGVMSWTPSKAIYKIWTDFQHCLFTRPPYRHLNPRHHCNPPLTVDGIRTDEEWLYHYTMPIDWFAWQELLPGLFASYKYHILRTMTQRGIPEPPLTPEQFRALKVIYFHGHPRPHTVKHPWNPFTRGVTP